MVYCTVCVMGPRKIFGPIGPLKALIRPWPKLEARRAEPGGVLGEGFCLNWSAFSIITPRN